MRPSTFLPNESWKRFGLSLSTGLFCTEKLNVVNDLGWGGGGGVQPDLMQKAFGNRYEDPLEIFVSRWGKNKMSFGSHTMIDLAGSVQEPDVMALSIEEKLYFAGEATYGSDPGSMMGAYQSGIREARKIGKSFSE